MVRHLAGELAAHHDVEIVSVIRTREEPLHRMPDGVRLRALADVRPQTHTWLPEQRKRARLEELPSRLMPTADARHRRYSGWTDHQLERYLRSLRRGAVIGMQPGVGIAIAKVASESVVRVVQEHVPFQLRKPDLHEEMRAHVGRLEQFLTLTRTDARRYRRYFGGEVPVRRMPNPAPDYHGPYADHTAKVVTAAGRLERLKGFDRLIDAWALVHARHPGWELRIYGRGSQRKALREQARSLGLSASVKLMGYTNHLQAELTESSLFVLPSRHEAFGMVMMEAMACGVPAVAFDCPTGPRDIIEDGVNGFLVKNRDVEGLAGRVIELIENTESRVEMGRYAHATAQSYNVVETAQKWQRLLRHLQNEKNPLSRTLRSITRKELAR